jgi:hypothetical protein
MPGGCLGITSMRYKRELEAGLVKKYNPNHDARGQFSSTGGGLHSMSPGEMASRLRTPDGGFTIDPVTGQEPTTGFAVSVHPDRSVQLDNVGKISSQNLLGHMVAFREANADVLATPHNNIGAWHDPATGIGHMDISAVVPTAAEAHALSVKHKQIAYFDIVKGQSVALRESA